MKKRIVVIGSSNTDMVMRVEEFPRLGETIMGHGFMQNLGGKGANQAVACSRLGGETAFIGKLGKDALGDNTLKQLACEQIDLSHLTQTEETSSGTAFITVNAHGENSIIVNSGANWKLRPEDIDAADGLLRDAALVLMQLETPIPTLVYAARKAHSYGARVVLNPAPAPQEPLPAELLQNVDLLILNETEAEQIGGIEVSDETLKHCFLRLNELGVKQVVITLGSKGAATIVDGEVRTVPAHKVEAVDTTAAGDTFCGALCVALCQGKDITEAIRFACAASAVTVTRMGAQQSIPFISEIK